MAWTGGWGQDKAKDTGAESFRISKVKAMDGTRAILQDTNNSTDDFEPRTKADPFHVFGK